MRKIIDISNQKFGNWTVIKISKKTKTATYWECRCDCGNNGSIRAYALKKGESHSCGKCNFHKEIFRNNFKSWNKIEDRAESIINREFSMYKGNSLSDGREFQLTRIEFETLIKKNCHYCLRAPYREVKDPFSEEVIMLNGVDRIDSAVGYITHNCVPCCSECNVAKSTLTLDKFKNLIKAIYRNINNI